MRKRHVLRKGVLTEFLRWPLTVVHTTAAQ